MPEGDTLYRTANTLRRALAGSVVASIDGTHPAVRANAHRLVDREVVSVRSHGKHVVIDLDGGWSVHTHLGMSGSWHLYRPGERWRRPTGSARVVVRTERAEAVCFSAPTVAVDRRASIDLTLAELGPDLLADDFDEADVLARAQRRGPGRPIGDVLLDQRIAAGIGNVYKSELLFLAGLHPDVPFSTVSTEDLPGIFRQAARLLRANTTGVDRVTTGDRRKGRQLWVYGRRGRPCRRCGTSIREGWTGEPERITYWCPLCQPAPADGAPIVRSSENG